MGSKEKVTQKTGKSGLFGSLRFKALLCVLLSALLVGVVMVAVAIPEISSQMKRITQNYIYDLTVRVGKHVDTVIAESGADEARSELPLIAGGVAVEDVSSSYCYVVDKTGTMVFHPDSAKIGNPVENAVIKGVVAALERGELPAPEMVEYEYRGVIKYAGYYVSSDGGLIAVVTADEADVLLPINSMVGAILVGAIGALVLSLLVAAVLLHLMLKPLETVSAVVNKFAYMDFRESPEVKKYMKRADEVGTIGRATEELRQQLVQVVEDLQEQSSTLYATSEKLQAKAAETADVINQVDSAVRDVADGASSQADETQSATENVLIIGNMIQDNNESIQEIKTSSDKIDESAKDAGDTLQQLTKINIQVKDAIEEIYDQTNTTNQSAVKIKEAAALITSIAEETNLLSLNASIEAARAGEHGRGFAVVASQIQKLAEQSNESAIRIEGIISELINDSERSVATMEEVRRIVEQQNISVKKTDEIFKTVQSGIQETLVSIDAMAKKTVQMETAREGVTDTVQNLSAIAEENAASTEETSASVTTVRASVDSIAENADNLNGIASKLEDTMKKFQI